MKGEGGKKRESFMHRLIGHRRFNLETLFWVFWGPVLVLVVVLVVVSLLFY
jgi:hypothetical protein